MGAFSRHDRKPPDSRGEKRTRADEAAAAGLSAQLSPPRLSVWPASSGVCRLSVSSLLAQKTAFLLEAHGLPEGWLEPERLEFSLRAQETRAIALRITPERRADARSGEYLLSIRLCQRGAPQRFVTLRMPVQLGSFGGLSLALKPETLADGEAFTLTLLNQGNETLPLALSAWEPANALDIQLARETIQLAPGERAQVAGRLTARRRPFIGRELKQAVAILARAQSASDYQVALPAQAVIKPRLGHRAMILLALAALCCLLLALLIVEPAPPEITEFALSPATVARGAPVELRLAGLHIERFIIEADGVPLAELPAAAAAYTLDTADFNDTVEIALIALAGERRDSASAQLRVYQPLELRRFSADKPFLRRNVRAALTIAWDLAGAAAVNISFPAEFEADPDSEGSGAQGEIVLRGAPSEAFQLQLQARDELGQPHIFPLDITVRPPECAPRADDAALRAGPDASFPIVGVAARNLPVLAQGTIASGAWLQVELANGISGWGAAEDFTCEGFEPSQLRLIAEPAARP